MSQSVELANSRPDNFDNILPILSEAASSRANIPERCYANKEVIGSRRKAITNCTYSQCIQTIKSDSMTKIDISIAYCKTSKNDPHTKDVCIASVTQDTLSKLQTTEPGVKTIFGRPNANNFQFWDIFTILFISSCLCIQIAEEKGRVPHCLKTKLKKSAVHRGSEYGTTRCIGNRAIGSLNCLIIFLATKVFTGILCGPGNMFYLVPTLFYVTMFESGLKFLMVAAVYVITAWAKINAKMTKSSGASSTFRYCLPSFITIPRVSDFIIAVVFISWIIHPILRVADKEYFLFANLCDIIFVVLGGLSAFIFGTGLIKI